jgi:hypothetical protein
MKTEDKILDELRKDMEKHYRQKKFKFWEVESKLFFVDKLSFMQRPTTLSIGFCKSNTEIYWDICFQDDNFKLWCGNRSYLFPLSDPNSIKNMKRYITKDIMSHKKFLTRLGRW